MKTDLTQNRQFHSVSFWLETILEIDLYDGSLKIIILEHCQKLLQTRLAAFIQNNENNDLWSK